MDTAASAIAIAATPWTSTPRVGLRKFRRIVELRLVEVVRLPDAREKVARRDLLGSRAHVRVPAQPLPVESAVVAEAWPLEWGAARLLA